MGVRLLCVTDTSVSDEQIVRIYLNLRFIDMFFKAAKEALHSERVTNSGRGHVGDANRNILPEIRDAHLRTEEVRERPGKTGRKKYPVEDDRGRRTDSPHVS